MSAGEGFQQLWDAVTDDAEERAGEYEAEGWETLRLHVGDVTPLPSTAAGPEGAARVGLDVMVPGDEFAELEGLLEETEFDEYQVYSRSLETTVLLLLIVRATDARRAVFVPMYYRMEDAEAMLAAAETAGTCHTYVRPLSHDRRVVFSHEDPTLFFPSANEE